MHNEIRYTPSSDILWQRAELGHFQMMCTTRSTCQMKCTLRSDIPPPQNQMTFTQENELFRWSVHIYLLYRTYKLFQAIYVDCSVLLLLLLLLFHVVVVLQLSFACATTDEFQQQQHRNNNNQKTNYRKNMKQFMQMYLHVAVVVVV